MTSSSTRTFIALFASAQRLGRPGTLTGQAWIEGFVGLNRPGSE
jgi:hypothetical protein